MKRLLLLMIICSTCTLEAQVYSNWPTGLDVISEGGELCFVSVEKSDSMPILCTPYNHRNSIALVNCLLLFTNDENDEKLVVKDLMIKNLYTYDTISKQGITLLNEEYYKENIAGIKYITNTNRVIIETNMKEIINKWYFIPDDYPCKCIPNDIMQTECLITVIIQ